MSFDALGRKIDNMVNEFKYINHNINALTKENVSRRKLDTMKEAYKLGIITEEYYTVFIRNKLYDLHLLEN